MAAARLRAAAGLLAGSAAVVAVRLAEVAHLPFPPCPFHALTGLNCPGCGSTRMLRSLLDGEVIAAGQHNPLALLALAWLAWKAGHGLVRPEARRRPHPQALKALLVVLVIFTIGRNVPGVVVFGPTVWYPTGW